MPVHGLIFEVETGACTRSSERQTWADAHDGSTRYHCGLHEAAEGGTAVSIGPVEYIAIAFPGNKFSGEIVPALQALVDNGTIRILDLVIIRKDADGNVEGIELSDASPEEQAALGALGMAGHRPARQEDVEDIGGALDPNSSCGADDLGERLGGRLRGVAPQRRWRSSSRTAGSRAGHRGADGRRRRRLITEARQHEKRGNTR